MAEIPSIIDGPRLEIKRAVEFDIPCPKCHKQIRVTQIEAGAVIKCPHSRCGNVIWRPEYVPRWWAKTKNFVLSLIVSFILGFFASFLASLAFEKYTDSGSVSPKANEPPRTATK